MWRARARRARAGGGGRGSPRPRGGRCRALCGVGVTRTRRWRAHREIPPRQCSRAEPGVAPRAPAPLAAAREVVRQPERLPALHFVVPHGRHAHWPPRDGCLGHYGSLRTTGVRLSSPAVRAAHQTAATGEGSAVSRLDKPFNFNGLTAPDHCGVTNLRKKSNFDFPCDHPRRHHPRFAVKLDRG